MKILLCNPNVEKPVYNQLGIVPPLIGICPPLGLGYLASCLRERGHSVAIYDFAGWGSDKVEEVLRQESPSLVGISCFTLTRSATLDVARVVKKVNSSIHVVVGGSHATAMWKQMLEQYSVVDSIVIGEGEKTLLRLVDVIENGEQLYASAGLACRKDGEATFGGAAMFIQDLNSLPMPIRSLSNKPPYKPFPSKYKLGRQWSLMSSRGCPYKCQFCSTSAFWGSKYRMRSVDNVVNELETLVSEYHAEDIEILDDAFTVNREWIMQICREINNRRLKFDWSATTRVNLVDDSMCRMLRQAGCKRLLLGIESFSPVVLANIGKKVSADQSVNAIKTGLRAGLKVCCLLMIGNPGESEESVKETVAAIKDAKPTDVVVNLTQVYPDTELYGIARDGGVLDDAYWLQEDKAAPIFDMEHTVEELKQYLDMVYDAHWSNHWYVSLYRKSGLRKIKNSFGSESKVGK